MAVDIEFESVCILDVNEWDEIVQEYYDKPYDFQQQDGCKERQIVELHVPDISPEDFEDLSFKEYKEGCTGVSLERWKNTDSSEKFGKIGTIVWGRNYYPHVSMVVNDLYSKGVLPEGKYLINIDW